MDSLHTFQRPVVAVQGLGFVGAAMCSAVAPARTTDGLPRYTVIGVDLPTPEGQLRTDAVNRGELTDAFGCADNQDGSHATALSA